MVIFSYNHSYIWISSVWIVCTHNSIVYRFVYTNAVITVLAL
jgi:hypothetical protein